MTPINMRLYRRFDADLIALNEMVPVNLLAEILLGFYAEGKRIRIVPQECRPFDVTTRKCIHLTVNVPRNAVPLVRKIRRGYRNQFCKSLVRDALVADPLWVFSMDQDFVAEENARLQELAKEAIVLPPGLRRKDYRLLLHAPAKEGKKKEEIKESFDDKENKNEPVTKDVNKNEPSELRQGELRPIAIPKMDFSDLEDSAEEDDNIDALIESFDSLF